MSGIRDDFRRCGREPERHRKDPHQRAVPIVAFAGSASRERRNPASETLDRVARRTPDATFEEFLGQYPLAGSRVREQERERLRRDFRSFLEHDWNDGTPRELHAVELPFGRPEPLALRLPEGPLYVRGFIDRVDVEAGRTLVRDLKSGRNRPRSGKEADPHPIHDVQIGLYGIVNRELARERGIPEAVAAGYVYADARGEQERAFDDDFDELEKAARGWLGLGRRLLAEGFFPRTPVEDDCRYCPFTVVCGPDGRSRATAVLAGAEGTLLDFSVLKGGGPGTGEEDDDSDD